MLSQSELIDRVKIYDPNTDEDLLKRAYAFSKEAHKTQIRESGDPYFSHPLEVATILTRWRLDSATIATALLHDTVEDTIATLAEIRNLFGPEIAVLVDGVTKLSKIELQSDKTKQAENFRKLVLAMSQDLRVLLVKLADRVHNMRTLYHIKSQEKKERIARETMEIYAPLAERIGMHDVFTELEDLSFSHLNPEDHQTIRKHLELMKQKDVNLISRIHEQLKQVLQRSGIPVTVTSGREKTPYSIWQKMQKKNIAFEQLSDIMAFRILVSSVSECYQALGTIHSTYNMVPGRFKDYISTPKTNKYQSLHTTVIGPENQRIEIQIRTKEMHLVAELGVAAHWQYKDGNSDVRNTNYSDETSSEGKHYRWVRSILEILEHASSPDEFLEHTKLAMFTDQVFCFTPGGDLINLPKGATPVDFAYAVHSKVGDHCVGAKVNGKLVPLRSKLSNGDQVEIVTASNHGPLPSWERFVVTGRARACIRRYIHAQERQEYSELGRSLVTKILRKIGASARDDLLEKLSIAFKYSDVDDFLVNMGKGSHLPREIVTIFTKEIQPEKYKTLKESEDPVNQKPEESADDVVSGWLEKSIKRRRSRIKTDPTLPIHGLIPGIAIHYAGCCHPLPGEPIIGIVTTGKGVTVHLSECESIKEIEEDRWIDLSWDDVKTDETNPHIGRLKIILLNVAGSLGSLATVLGKMNANIANLKITHRTSEFYELYVDAEVKNIEHLHTVMASLRTSKAVHSVDRE